jgi:protein-L-isoaspartate(D-aspartate) O-methyltransferase
MNLNLARFNMVQQQVRSWDVLDPRVLQLMTTVPREQFVPTAFQQLAFSDTSIPIGYGQVTLPPKMIGRVLQALTLDKRASVLEIGTGTGYMTSLLCQLAKKVTTIEIIPELAKEAFKNFKTLNLSNIVSEIGDGIQGWSANASYDAIVLTGSVPVLPASLSEQLTNNGRLFAVVGKAPAMSAVLLTRVNNERWTKQNLFETDIAPLLNAPQLNNFQF